MVWVVDNLCRLNIKIVFPGRGILMLKIRLSQVHLIVNMGIPILVKWHLYIEVAPRCDVMKCTNFSLDLILPNNPISNRIHKISFQLWVHMMWNESQTWIFICIIFHCNNLCQILKINIKMFIHDLNLYILVSRDPVKFHLQWLLNILKVWLVSNKAALCGHVLATNKANWGHA